jgi:hypothetical protein
MNGEQNTKGRRYHVSQITPLIQSISTSVFSKGAGQDWAVPYNGLGYLENIEQNPLTYLPRALINHNFIRGLNVRRIELEKNDGNKGSTKRK